MKQKKHTVFADDGRARLHLVHNLARAGAKIAHFLQIFERNSQK
jgi:hypothetical protein